MSIDLPRVNIPLKQFQKIASGKYNAGEVTLAGETKFGGPITTSTSRASTTRPTPTRKCSR